MDTVFTAIERAALPKQVVYSDFAAAAAMIFDCQVHALKGRGFFLDVSLCTASYNNRMLPAAPNRGRCSFHTEIRREEPVQCRERLGGSCAITIKRQREWGAPQTNILTIRGRVPLKQASRGGAAHRRSAVADGTGCRSRATI